MDAKHTPGPWLAAAGPSSVVGWPIVGSQGRSICRLAWFPPPPDADKDSRADHDLFTAECGANARLIAAAPDLLAALAELIEANNDAALDDPDDDEHAQAMDRLCDATAAAERAIAKAEGRS